MTQCLFPLVYLSIGVFPTKVQIVLVDVLQFRGSGSRCFVDMQA